MLASRSRIPRRVGFSNTLRLGSRTGNRALVVYVRIPDNEAQSQEQSPGTQVGVIVPKREIPLAAHRNRVKRRLRHILAAQLSEVPEGTQIIVRALRPSRDMTSEEIGRFLDRALRASLEKELSRG